MTATLRIEHATPDFAAWKAVFDSDPVDREASGVRRYRIMRPVDDPHYVMIDLELDSTGEAERLLAALQALWAGAAQQIATNPQARIVENVATGEYPAP